MMDDISIKRNSFNNLVNNSMWAFLSSGILVLVGFVVNVVLGNQLGEAGFGVYSLAATIYLLLGMVFFVGVPYSLIKYTAEFIDDQDMSAQYYTASLISVMITTVLGSTITFFLRGWIAIIFRIPELEQIIPIICFGFPFLGFYRIGVSRLNGLRQIRKMAGAEIFRYFLFLILVLFIVVYKKGGIYEAILSLVLSDILISPYLLIQTKLFRTFNIKNLKSRILKLSWFGSRLVLARIFEELDVRSNLIMVGMFLSKTDIGLYSLASMIASAVSFVPGAIQKITGPLMTELFARNRIDSIGTMMNQVMRFTSFVLTSIGLFLFLFYDLIIKLLYPSMPGFLYSENTFRILVIGAIFYGITVSISPIFTSMERPDIVLRIAIIRVLLSIGLTLIFIGPFGILGAAVGGSGTGFLVFGFWIFYIRKLLNIHINWKSLGLIFLLGIVIGIIGNLIGSLTRISNVKYAIGLVALICYSGSVIAIWRVDLLIRRILGSILTRGN